MNSENISEDDLRQAGVRDLCLRPYQLVGVQWYYKCWSNHHGCILADEMGLGKTCQTISFLTYLFGKKLISEPALILSPLSIIRNWTSEFKRFSNLDIVNYTGDKNSRGDLRREIKNKKNTGNLNVVLTTYELCLNDEEFLRKISWSVLIVDEGHRLKNPQSQLYQAVEQFKIKHRVLLTGTPVQNNLDELCALLSFIQPDSFEPTAENVEIKKLLPQLDKYMLRRTKAEVVKDLPRKTEVVLYHGISTLQKKYYKAILMKDVDAFNQAMKPSKTSLMNILMHLRKCVDHPYLFDGVEPEPFELGEHLVEASGKLAVLDKLLAYLKDMGHKVLIFSQMTRMLDILQDYLHYRCYTYERLDGSVRGEERYIAVDNFNRNDDTFVFLLSTRAGGQGLNLTSADTVIFVDSDFNPQADLQAAARCHRIGQTRPVKIVRLIGRNTIEEIILKRAEQKLQLTATVMSSGKEHNSIVADENELQEILKFGLDKLLAADESGSKDIDFTRILGTTVNGQWDTEGTLAVEDEEGKGTTVADDMYVFEGTNYAQEATIADKAVFDQLVAEQLQQVGLGPEEGRTSRRKGIAPIAALPDVVQRKPKKQLTPEELEARRLKRAENAARCAKEAEEEEVRRAQEKRDRLERKWQESGYRSLNLSDECESDEEASKASDASDELLEDEGTAAATDIHYVVGDVTHPQLTSPGNALVVHCVDDAGRWGKGGIFDAISTRSQVPQQKYIEAGKNRDLALGDAHLVPLDDVESRANGKDFVVLVVAQHVDRKTQARSGVNLTALSQALQRIYVAAKKKRASVHLPRIGYKTSGFNWYGTERLIRKHLAAKGIQTYIYYFQRKQALKRSLQRSHSEDGSDEEGIPVKVSQQRKNDSASTSKLQRYSDEDSTSSNVHDNASNGDSGSFLQGISIHLYNFAPDEQRTLTRQIISADGDVHATVEQGTNYIVVSGNNFNHEELEVYKNDFEETAIVMREWLVKSIESKTLLDPAKFVLEI